MSLVTWSVDLNFENSNFAAVFLKVKWSRDFNGPISFIVQWKCSTKYLSWIEFKLAVTWSNFEKFCRRTAPLLADVNPLTTEWRKSRTEAALTLHESNKWQSVAKVGNVVIYTCSRRIFQVIFLKKINIRSNASMAAKQWPPPSAAVRLFTQIETKRERTIKSVA